MKVLRRKILTLGVSVLGLLAACTQGKIDAETLGQLYGEALEKPAKKLKVYHLGHSLVGRTMPSMLQQVSGDGHDYRSQLGWGTPLKAHWEPDEVINGFEKENNHEKFQAFDEALNSNEFDVFVLTEMVEIKAAIKYFQSAKYFKKFVDAISEKSPRSRIYFYESWHEVNDPEGWNFRLERDYQKYWLSQVLAPTLMSKDLKQTVYVIPVGQVMLALFKEIEKSGGVEGLNKPEDLFARNEDGSLDPIHVNEVGEYLVALVHYAVLYQQDPTGLPNQLKNEFGEQAMAPSQEAAQLMQRVTWQVVSNDFRTGITGFSVKE